MFRLAILAIVAAVVSADIPVDSPLGKKLLSKAQVIEPARHLNNNNNQNQRDISFVSQYSIKYLGCNTLTQIAGNQNGGNNNKNNNNQNGAMLYSSNIVRFALCPTSACSSSCKGGGEYVVNMADFVDSYTEAKMNLQEYTCESIRENCYCDNANDDANCEYSCYVAANHTECTNYQNQQDFQIQRYLYCQQMGENKNNGNNNGNNNGGNQAYYVGPYCSAKDGKSIMLAVFSDQGCTAMADPSLFASTVGYDLPYSSSSIVASDCINCENYAENNNNNNQNNAYANPLEQCQNVYNAAARCEKNMEVSYQDNNGCEYITNTLPKLESATRTGGSKSGSSSKAAVVFAWMFALTTILFGAYAYFLYRKIKRGSVGLAGQDMA